jgi:hypothetical protein
MTEGQRDEMAHRRSNAAADTAEGDTVGQNRANPAADDLADLGAQEKVAVRPHIESRPQWSARRGMTIGNPLGFVGGIALLLAAGALAAATTAAMAQPGSSRPVVRDHRSGAWQPVPRGHYRPGYDKDNPPTVRDHRSEGWQPKCGRYACDRPRPRH